MSPANEVFGVDLDDEGWVSNLGGGGGARVGVSGMEGW